MIETGKLARLELFEGLPDEALAAIAEISREMGFEAGEIIFSPEMQSTKAFLLVEGSVRLTVHAPPLPGPVVLAVVGTPGQPFGFSSSSARSATTARPPPSPPSAPWPSKARPCWPISNRIPPSASPS